MGVRPVTTVRVSGELPRVLPDYSYRRPVDESRRDKIARMDPRAIVPVEGFFTTEVVVDVQAVVESGATDLFKVNFTVYACPNQFTSVAERRWLGSFMLDLDLAGAQEAIKEATSACVKAYINRYRNNNENQNHY